MTATKPVSNHLISGQAHYLVGDTYVKARGVNHSQGREFFIEYLHSLNKRGAKIDEISYTHPKDVEGMSKTATSLFRFLKLGSNYIVRIFISLLNRR